MSAESGRRIPGDWHDGVVPANVAIADDVLVESSYSFTACRGDPAGAVRIGRGSSIYQGTMFDVGPSGRVTVGEYAMLNGARIVADAAVEIGDYALISWNVLLMDSYRVPFNAAARRRWLRDRTVAPRFLARPVRIGRNVWIGFDACVLPGVQIGEGAVVGARSVVSEDVPAYAVVAGNPARVVRMLTNDEISASTSH